MTSDIWTSNCGEPYICITAHFANKKYKLKNILIDFSNMLHPYGGVDIMEKIDICIKDFKIDEKISILTKGNATNNIKTISELKKI